MIKTKLGFHKITNGTTTWYFYEQAVTSVLTAYIDGNIDKVDELSILVVNNFTQDCEKSNWPHTVSNEFELGNQIIRERHRAERGE